MGVDCQGVKPGHHWQLSVTSGPHLKDRAQKTGEGQNVYGEESVSEMSPDLQLQVVVTFLTMKKNQSLDILNNAK